MPSRGFLLKDAGYDSLEALHDDCKPSAFGHGKERVMNELYRLARELPADSLGLNFDPIGHTSGILPAVSAFCKTGTTAALYKLNSYTTGQYAVVLRYSLQRQGSYDA